MIIVQLTGGLGNQMFQYATGRALSVNYKTNLYLDTSFFSNQNINSPIIRKYNLDIFDIKARINKYNFNNRITHTLKNRILKNPETQIIEENPENIYDNLDAFKNNSFLKGYWQSEIYFTKYDKFIRNDFSFKLTLNPRSKDIVKTIQSTESVSVHFRRNDYVSDKKTNEFHGTCSNEFYYNAFEKITEKIQKPVFFIFSDDIHWVKNNIKLPENHYFIDWNKGEHFWIDMFLMSKCKHNIIANSSFSWWGAWLNVNNKKMVIAPKKWFADKRYTAQSKNIIPVEWLKI